MAKEDSLNYVSRVRVEEALDNTPLSHLNFDITSNDSIPLEIFLKDSSDYYFRVTKPNNFFCEMQPGEVYALDRASFGGILDALPTIEKWSKNVFRELKTRHQRIESDNFIKSWDELTKAKYEDPEKPLDQEDFEKWKEIVKDLQARISELEKKGKIPQEEVSNIVKEGEEIEGQAGSVPGKNWMLIGGKYLLRLLKYASLDPEIRHAIFNHVQEVLKALPQHVETIANSVHSLPM